MRNGERGQQARGCDLPLDFMRAAELHLDDVAVLERAVELRRGPGRALGYVLAAHLAIEAMAVHVLRVAREIMCGGVLSLIHISEPTRLLSISYAVFCL